MGEVSAICLMGTDVRRFAPKYSSNPGTDSTMQPAALPVATPPTSSHARYGGYLSVPLPEGHPSWSRDPEGGWADPRAVIVPLTGQSTRYASVDAAVEAARVLSAGKRPAVAVVRSAEGPTFEVERLLVKPSGYRDDSLEPRYRTIDLESLSFSPNRPGSLWQPLQSQRQVMVERVIDGDVTLKVSHYKSSRPEPKPKPVTFGGALSDARKLARAGAKELAANPTPAVIDAVYRGLDAIDEAVARAIGAPDAKRQHAIVRGLADDAAAQLGHARSAFENLDMHEPVVAPVVEHMKSAVKLLSDAIRLGD